MKLNKIGVALVALCALALFTIGCGKSSGGSRPGLVKGEGVVTYNGQTVDDAIIEMRPVVAGTENYVAVGRTDAQGKFAMMTDRPGDGILPGKYKTVVKKEVQMIEGKTREEYEKELAPDGKGEIVFDKGKLTTENLTPAKYADPLNKPLEIEIPEKGDKNIQITLED